VCVQQVYPDSVVNPFGSYANGISIHCGDLDLSVDKRIAPSLQGETLSVALPLTTDRLTYSEVQPVDCVERDQLFDKTPEVSPGVDATQAVNAGEQTETVKKKQKIHLNWGPLIKLLEKHPLVDSLLVLPYARVKLIKVSFKCKIEADISFNQATSPGFAALKLMLHSHGSALSDLSFFLKVYLNQLNLDNAANGGLGSFRMYVLVSEHIKRNPALVTDPNNPDLGALLLGFLKYYSNEQNYVTIEIPGYGPVKYALSRKMLRKLCKACSMAHTALVKTITHEVEQAATPTEIPSVTSDVSWHASCLAKVINIEALQTHKEESNAACVELLNRTSDKHHKDHTQHKKQTNVSGPSTPVIAASTAGINQSNTSCAAILGKKFGLTAEQPKQPKLLKKPKKQKNISGLIDPAIAASAACINVEALQTHKDESNVAKVALLDKKFDQKPKQPNQHKKQKKQKNVFGPSTPVIAASAGGINVETLQKRVEESNAASVAVMEKKFDQKAKHYKHHRQHKQSKKEKIISGPSTPMIATSTAGAARAYSVSVRSNNTFFGNDFALPMFFPVRPFAPVSGMRFQYTPYPVFSRTASSSFVYSVGSVFRKLYQLKVLR